MAWHPLTAARLDQKDSTLRAEVSETITRLSHVGLLGV